VAAGDFAKVILSMLVFIVVVWMIDL